MKPKRNLLQTRCKVFGKSQNIIPTKFSLSTNYNSISYNNSYTYAVCYDVTKKISIIIFPFFFSFRKISIFFRVIALLLNDNLMRSMTSIDKLNLVDHKLKLKGVRNCLETIVHQSFQCDTKGTFFLNLWDKCACGKGRQQFKFPNQILIFFWLGCRILQKK